MYIIRCFASYIQYYIQYYFNYVLFVYTLHYAWLSKANTLVARASAALVAPLTPLHLWQAHACSPKMMLGPLLGGVVAPLPRNELLVPTLHDARHSPALKCLLGSSRNTCFPQLVRHLAIVHGTSVCFLPLAEEPCPWRRNVLFHRGTEFQTSMCLPEKDFHKAASLDDFTDRLAATVAIKKHGTKPVVPALLSVPPGKPTFSIWIATSVVCASEPLNSLRCCSCDVPHTPR